MDQQCCVFKCRGRELVDYEHYPINLYWTKIELTLDQCCGSGSGQIRNVFSKSDPE
jgi:hypothetical protein